MLSMVYLLRLHLRLHPNPLQWLLLLLRVRALLTKSWLTCLRFQVIYRLVGTGPTTKMHLHRHSRLSACVWSWTARLVRRLTSVCKSRPLTASQVQLMATAKKTFRWWMHLQLGKSCLSSRFALVNSTPLWVMRTMTFLPQLLRL